MTRSRTSGVLVFRHAVYVSLLALVLASCRLGEGPATIRCPAASAPEGMACRAYAQRSVERIPTPFVENGRAVTLELVVYRPLTAGPYPTLVFHHGSTGSGDNPALFRNTYTSESLAKVFVDAGWMVLFPQRRGRGASDGLYDEGFEPDRSRYSCRREYALPGLEHALADAAVITDAVRTRSDVDTTRLIVGGISRGGILAVAHAARRPLAYRGVLNFVGGWLGESCVDAVPVNRGTFTAAATASRSSHWIYAQHDPFYSVTHSRANFDAFTAAGGKGTFTVYQRRDATANGHQVINEPSLWRDAALAFATQGAR